tara:strand:+ start:976 stop:1428 length:453 start_codon:yes stop_codon:yes gene_type:complete
MGGKMTGGTQENAMTEIALAMAMGFFSIMVLTMISMGVPTKPNVESKKHIPIFTLLPSDTDQNKTSQTNRKDVFIIFDGNSYLDHRLKPINLGIINKANRIILALTPELSLKEALSAQAKLMTSKVILTTLNERWKRALANHRKELINEK